MGSLRITGLGKAYRRYHNKWGRLAEWLGASPQHQLYWALRDVSFSVAPGEAVGIVGANGAGKSTLLKIITGTTRATTGTCETNGRISALLELGLGFHPEFTGRQNVYMAGHVQGLALEHLHALMRQVEEFAEIGDYIDQPVRTYSSGMQVRLAFSVATVVRPEILIVDEALSVGDIYFQQKCFDRIRRFRDAGTTLLFVTHSPDAVYALCSRAILLERGTLQLDGTPKEVLDLYHARIVARNQKAGAQPLEVVSAVAPPAPQRIETGVDAPVEVSIAVEAPVEAPAAVEAPGAVDAPVEVPGAVDAPVEVPAAPEAPPVAPHSTGSYFSEGVVIEAVNLLDEAGRRTEVFLGDQAMVVEVVVAFDRELDDPHFGFQVRDRLGQPLFMTTTHGLRVDVGRVKPGEARAVRFRFLPSIAPGQYTVTAGVANRGRFDGSFEEALVRHQDATAFTIVQPSDEIRWAGMINLRPSVEIVAGRPGRARA